MYLGVNYYEQKHLATALQCLQRQRCLSLLLLQLLMLMHATNAASAEQYSYPAPQAATPAYQTSYATSAPRPGYKPLPADALYSRRYGSTNACI